MKITKKAKYALDAIGFIYSKQGEESPNVSSKQISKELDLSEGFLSLVMGELRNAGILKSKKGPGGGYLLGTSIEEITLNKVLLAIDESIKFKSDEERSSLCNEIENQLQLQLEEFGNISFNSFIKD